jgi:hypothetical protein
VALARRSYWPPNICSFSLAVMQAWEAHDPTLHRPIAAPLERCAELLGVDLATVLRAAAHVEPYVRIDGTEVWSLMQLERQLRPQAYGRVRGATSPVGAGGPQTPDPSGGRCGTLPLLPCRGSGGVA